MGFESGLISYRRFQVIGESPMLVDEALLEKFGTLALGEELTTAEVDYGWTAGRHVLDADFTVGNCVFNNCLRVGLRVDKNQVPANLKKAYVELESSVLAKSNPSGFISRAQKREAKELARRKIEEDLASGKFRRHAMADVLWDLDKQTVLAAVTDTQAAQLCELFERTTGLTLVQLNADVVAQRYVTRLGRSRDLEDATPTLFGGNPAGLFASYPWADRSVKTHAYLGNEFAMWLVWLDRSQQRLTTPLGEAVVLMTSGVDLHCIYGENGKDVIKSDYPITLPETPMAMAQGKVPRRLGMRMAIVNNQYNFTFAPEGLHCAGLKLPEVDTADSPRVLFEERVTMLRDFVACIDAMFEQFLAIRLSESWAGVVSAIGAWVTGKNSGSASTSGDGVNALVDAAKSVNRSEAELRAVLEKNPKLAKAAETLEKMLSHRESVRTILGDGYAKCVAMTWPLIDKRMHELNENALDATLALAKHALEEEGNLLKSKTIVAAYIEHAMMEEKATGPLATERMIEQYEQARNVGPAMAKAMKKLVGTLQPGESITFSTNIPGSKPVTIDAEGAKRVKANCDAIIAGGKIASPAALPQRERETTVSNESRLQAEFDRQKMGTILMGGVVRPSVLDALEAAGIKTGADLRNGYDNRKFHKIAGVGPAAWEKIADAMYNWMIARTVGAAPKATEPMPDAGKIDQPATDPTQDPIDDDSVKPLFTNVASLTGHLAQRASGQWSWKASVRVGKGSIRQEKTWDWSPPHLTRDDAIEDCIGQLGVFANSASEVADKLATQQLAQIHDACAQLREREGKAAAKAGAA